jgi:hypothetical protein
MATAATPFTPVARLASNLDCNCGCRPAVETLTAIVEQLQTKLAAVEGELAALGQRVRGTKGTAKVGGDVNVEFSDERLLDCRASSFLTGRVLTSDECSSLIRNRFENIPPISFDADDIRRINVAHACGNAPSLSKWAVFELFSVRDLVGRNCLGGGHYAGVRGVAKVGIDPYRLDIIKAAVFALYAPTNDAEKKMTWMKCVDKINTDIRYLFGTSLRKDWLKVGLPQPPSK